MKYFVMSDIHGFYTFAIEALKNAGYYAEKGAKKIVLLGDYMDRGKEVKQMQDWLLSLLKNQEAILLCGNHEDLFKDFVKKRYGVPQLIDVKNGIFQTALLLCDLDKEYKQLLSIQQQISGLEYEEKTSLFLRKLYNKCLETPFYQEILPCLKSYFETNNYVFTHGWIPCKWDESEKCYKKNVDYHKAYSFDWADSRWINGMSAYKDVRVYNKNIVCGHFSASWGHCHINGKGSVFGSDAIFSPFSDKGILAIDACTAVSHKVNCVVIAD